MKEGQRCDCAQSQGFLGIVPAQNMGLYVCASGGLGWGGKVEMSFAG